MRLPNSTRRLLPLLLTFAIVGCRAGATEPAPIVPDLPDVDPRTVLLFDNFDRENGGRGENNWAGFANWNVVAGCVDLHGNGFHDVQQNNGLYVDLDGSCERAGTIESKAAFSLTPGGYILEFWLAGNNRDAPQDTVVVSLGALYEERFVLEGGAPFRQLTRPVSVTAVTQARLRFAHQGGDNQGILLDQVRLRRAN